MSAFNGGLLFFNTENFVMLDYGTGSIPDPEKWNKTCHYNPFHMFYYIIKGRCEVRSTITFSTTALTPEKGFLIPTGTYDFTCLEPTIMFAVHFFCPLSNGSDILANLSGNVMEIAVSKEDYALQNIMRCFEENQITNADILVFKGFLHQIVGQALKDRPTVSIPHHPQELSDVTLQVIDYVKRHLSAQLKVQDIAAKMSFHPNYLSKLFYAEIGMTLKRYIDTQLYQKALLLLSTSNKPAQDIARELRFSSPYYFSSFLKKFLGLSPENYRKIRGSLRPITEIE